MTQSTTHNAVVFRELQLDGFQLLLALRFDVVGRRLGDDARGTSQLPLVLVRIVTIIVSLVLSCSSLSSSVRLCIRRFAAMKV